jgi:uncharacterized membrane protein
VENSVMGTDATGEKAAARAGMESVVGYILLGGVLLSVALIAGGLAWHWAVTGQLQLEYSIGNVDLIQFIFSDLQQLVVGRLRPRYLINLGIAVLVLTPYVRIMVSVLYFALVARNWKYALFTAAVLGVLTYSLFGRWAS